MSRTVGSNPTLSAILELSRGHSFGSTGMNSGKQLGIEEIIDTVLAKLEIKADDGVQGEVDSEDTGGGSHGNSRGNSVNGGGKGKHENKGRENAIERGQGRA